MLKIHKRESESACIAIFLTILMRCDSKVFGNPILQRHIRIALIPKKSVIIQKDCYKAWLQRFIRQKKIGITQASQTYLDWHTGNAKTLRSIRTRHSNRRDYRHTFTEVTHQLGISQALSHRSWASLTVKAGGLQASQRTRSRQVFDRLSPAR